MTTFLFIILKNKKTKLFCVYIYIEAPNYLYWALMGKGEVDIDRKADMAERYSPLNGL